MAENQRTHQAMKKALKNSDIMDRNNRNFDINKLRESRIEQNE